MWPQLPANATLIQGVIDYKGTETNAKEPKGAKLFGRTQTLAAKKFSGFSRMLGNVQLAVFGEGAGGGVAVKCL